MNKTKKKDRQIRLRKKWIRRAEGKCIDKGIALQDMYFRLKLQKDIYITVIKYQL